MMNIQLKEIVKVWPEIKPIFSIPHSKKDYKILSKRFKVSPAVFI